MNTRTGTHPLGRGSFIGALISLLIWGLLIWGLLAFVPPSAAQTPNDTQAQTAQTERVDVAQIAPPAAQSEAPTPQTVSNEEIAEKLRALEAAEQDFLNAARQQLGSEPTSEPHGADDGTQDADTLEPETKKSLIPTDPEALKALGKSILDKVIGWLTSPPFLAQIGAIFLMWFLAPILAKQLKTRVFLFRDRPAEDMKFKLVRDYIYRSGEFLRAVMQVALLALFALILKNIPPLGQDWLVKLAQGLAVVFLLYRMIKTFLPNPLVQKLATWIVIPIAVLMVFGYFDNLITALNGTVLMQMGDTPITAMTVVRLVIFGAIFFKLGEISNTKGQTAIRSQETLDAGTREVVAKIFQILLFIIMVVLVLSAANIPLSGLVVIFSAVGLGIGFGLQPIAANFVSGLIILFDRSVKVGDFVVLPDGQEGHVDAINMRSTTVETADGKDIMVPNTKFTEEAYENWTHKDPRQRYEVEFAVPYDTDLDSLEGILMPAVLKYEKILTDPEEPDLELRSFGESGINMAIEFWCEGIDDGPNKFTSDINFIVWRTLKENGISMPFPQRDVHLIKPGKA